MHRFLKLQLLLVAGLCVQSVVAEFLNSDGTATAKQASSIQSDSLYTLGPDDVLSIRVLDIDEIAATTYTVDLRGRIDVPHVGSVQASGRTLIDLQSEIVQRLRDYLRTPVVTIGIVDYRSQPVSVLGAVGNPGVHQIHGRRSLYEVISEAGGLRPDAGNLVKITRLTDYGAIPLPNARPADHARFSVAEVNIRSIMEAQHPEQNIQVRPHDVVTVPKGELVYVIGAVNRSGGFVLSEHSSMSVLQALSLAEGVQRTAGLRRAAILRPISESSSEKRELAIDIKGILKGSSSDVPLFANDILFVPTSTAKAASYRAIDAVVQTGTGIAIYHPF